MTQPTRDDKETGAERAYRLLAEYYRDNPTFYPNPAGQEDDYENDYEDENEYSDGYRDGYLAGERHNSIPARWNRLKWQFTETIPFKFRNAVWNFRKRHQPGFDDIPF